MSQLHKRLGDLERAFAKKSQLDKPRQIRIGIYSSDRSPELLYVIDPFGNKLEGTEHDEGITLTEDYLPLFNPKFKFVSMRGGRGGGKTDSVALVLVLFAYTRKLRILCFREVQNSIRQSVYATLKKAIEKLKLESWFLNSTDNEIRGLNGSIFIFKGLRDQTVENIKSYSDIDICWGEEARSLTERSLQVLVPTIRNEGARFFFTWNPQQDTDAVYLRYVNSQRENVRDILVNYNNNPWFPSTIEEERTDDKARLPSSQYEWIWEGKILPAVIGAVYFDEMQLMTEQGRICRVKVDPMKPVDLVMDLGIRDHTSILLVQQHLSEIRIVGHIDSGGKALSWYDERLRLFKQENNVGQWGTLHMPHDATHRDYKLETPQSIMRDLGWNNIRIMPAQNVELGIRSARVMFPNVWIDQDCTWLIECLKRYHYEERTDGSLQPKPEHDIYSHAADAFRYLAGIKDQLTNNRTRSDWSQTMPRRGS